MIVILDRVMPQLKFKSESKILDIGTGRGYMAIGLALFGQNVITGEPEGANWADWEHSAKLVKVERKIKFMALNAENLLFPDNYFDGIFLYASLHHIEHKSQALQELFRVLKPNGKLVIIELTHKAAVVLKERFKGHPDAVDPRKYTKHWNYNLQTFEDEFLNVFIYDKNF